MGSKQNRRGYLLHQHSISPSELTGPWEGTCAYLGHEYLGSVEPWVSGTLGHCARDRTQTGPPVPEIPVTRLDEADGHSGQDGTPSLVAVPPDPPSGFRWQATCHCVTCFSGLGARTPSSETRYPVAYVETLCRLQRLTLCGSGSLRIHWWGPQKGGPEVARIQHTPRG